jgi:predicted dehydrogenase
MISRRTFLDGLAVTAASAAVSSTAKSYAQILGSNNRLNFAVLGLNGRGYAHLDALHANAKDARISHVCDVDSTILARFAAKARTTLGYAPATETDYRKVLASKDVDAITVALPDHWHAPMAIYGLEAGKNVYVEKPSSHNPREGELLVEAQKKYGKLVQVGDQQRSSDYTIKVIQQIREGLIGEPYYAKAWYVNKRKSMGIGKPAAVPSTLNWELWQGPAPRHDYVDNVHPYNWHWLTRYGTGEALNNGTHEVDVCRWALGVEYPTRVSASGGRYNFKDDWQFYDTLNTSFEYGPDKMLSWEGRSCQGMKIYGRERGSSILGTKGSILIDRDGYEHYDWNGKMVDEFKTGKQTSSADTVGRDSMTDAHFLNFINGIKHGEELHSPIPVANVSVTILQLSNIAYFTQRALNLDTANGHIKGDSEAMKLWGRTYEKGWEPKV